MKTASINIRRDDRMRSIVSVAQQLAKVDRDKALDLLTSNNVPLHVAVRVMAGQMNMRWSRS